MEDYTKIFNLTPWDATKLFNKVKGDLPYNVEVIINEIRYDVNNRYVRFHGKQSNGNNYVSPLYDLNFVLSAIRDTKLNKLL